MSDLNTSEEIYKICEWMSKTGEKPEVDIGYLIHNWQTSSEKYPRFNLFKYRIPLKNKEVNKKLKKVPINFSEMNVRDTLVDFGSYKFSVLGIDYNSKQILLGTCWYKIEDLIKKYAKYSNDFNKTWHKFYNEVQE